MSNTPQISINVDPSNPGQFFACCGLLELADRLWPGVEGWFEEDDTKFKLINHRVKVTSAELLSVLRSGAMNSNMTTEQISRLKRLLNLKKSSMSPTEQEEKLKLQNLWRVERIHCGDSVDLWVDWWNDSFSGGAQFKTWAGKQFALDLVLGMQDALQDPGISKVNEEDWLGSARRIDSLPLYFDARFGGSSSSIDVGFSLDALKLGMEANPLVELAAFIGLQRFRPAESSRKRFRYYTWILPMDSSVASAVVGGNISVFRSTAYEFQLLYRTQYLKSFLPSKKIRASND